MSVLGASLAQAAPFQMLQPARTAVSGQTEMGGAMHYLTTPDLGPLGEGSSLQLSGWGRYGATDRIEVSGGAWMPLSPIDLGLHGGARLLLVGAPGGEGLHVSLGASLGTRISAIRAVSFALTAPVGASLEVVDVWVAPQLSVASTPVGSALHPGLELGAGVDAGGIPVYLAASYTDASGVDVIGLGIGVGYDPGM